MILDKEQQFSDSQAFSATGVSTKVIDLGGDRNIGIGEPMEVVINVEVAADLADGNETYQFDLQTDTVEGFGSPTVVVSRTIAKEDLTAGSVHTIGVPADLSTERFLRMNQVLGGTTPSITISSHLQPKSGVAKDVAYPDNLTITS